MNNVIAKEELQTLFATQSLFHIVIAVILFISSKLHILYVILFIFSGIHIISFIVFTICKDKYVMNGIILLSIYIFSEIISLIIILINDTNMINDIELISVIAIFLMDIIISFVIIMFLYKKYHKKNKRFQLVIEKINNIESDEKITCCICLNEIEKTVCSLKCNHKFHKKCVEDWLEKNPTCPICRDQNEKV